MHTPSLFSVIPNATTTQTLPFFFWYRMRLREGRARDPTANRSRLVRRRSEGAASLGAHSYRKTYILNDYSTLHLYEPFHKECLIKRIYGTNFRTSSDFDTILKYFYLCIIYVLFKF